jgi:hypothetical protein
MPVAQSIGFAASMAAGALFLLVALIPWRSRITQSAPAPIVTPPPSAEPRIYWPILLGTGQRDFDRGMRLAIVEQLGRVEDEWRIPILLCAREQECDEQILAAVERALR